MTFRRVYIVNFMLIHLRKIATFEKLCLRDISGNYGEIVRILIYFFLIKNGGKYMFLFQKLV